MMKIPNFIATKLHFILHLYILFFNGLYCLSKFAVVVVCAAEFVVWPWVRQVRWLRQKISATLKISAIPKINMMLIIRATLKLLKQHKYSFTILIFELRNLFHNQRFHGNVATHQMAMEATTETARTIIILIS